MSDNNSFRHALIYFHLMISEMILQKFHRDINHKLGEYENVLKLELSVNH